MPTNTDRYRVNIGHTRTGKARNVYFATIEAARRACNEVFEKTNHVLSIEKVH